MVLQRRKNAPTTDGHQQDDGHAAATTRVQADASDKPPNPQTRGAVSIRTVFIILSISITLLAIFIHQNPFDLKLPSHLQDTVDTMNSTITSLKNNLHEQLPRWWQRGDKSAHLGMQAAARGDHPLYNIVIVPGFVTSGLEMWRGDFPCPYSVDFRQRVWGGLGMTLAGRNTTCWLEGLSLDPITGLDKSTGTLRAMRGFDAIDYFVPQYVVWAAVINILADMGAGVDVEMIPAPYDWRLPLHLMEHRDGWFTRLKSHIETTYALNGKKTMVMAHSWGANVFTNFLYWVDTLQPGWVEQHLAVFTNIAGPLLGVSKSLSPLLSGEVKDLVELGNIIRTMMDWYVSPENRAATFRTWGSAIQMLPVGGRAVWGDVTGAPDDPPVEGGEAAGGGSYGSVLEVEVQDAATPTTIGLDVTQALEILLQEGGPFAEHIRAWTAPKTLAGVPPTLSPTLSAWVRPSIVAQAAAAALHHPPPASNTTTKEKQNGKEEKEGGEAGRPLSARAKLLLPAKNPLTTPLPNAPSLQIYCMHGVGLPTERGYRYTYSQEEEGATWRLNETAGGSSNVDPDDSGPVVTSDGDATVPLISLGAVCGAPWQSKTLNPGGATVTIRQYLHKATALLGQGPESADHVDVLQNRNFLEDVIEIVSGRGGGLGNSIHSDVMRISDNVWRRLA